MKNLFCNKLGVVFTDNRFIISRKGRTILNRTAVVIRYNPTNELVCAGEYVSCIDKAPNGVACYPIHNGVIYKHDDAEYLFSELLKEAREWYFLGSLCNVATPVKTSDTDRKALISCFKNTPCRLLPMPLVASMMMSGENTSVIYMAEKYLEVSTINLKHITRSSFWNFGIKDLYPLFSALIPEIVHSEITLRGISSSYFNGQDHRVRGADRDVNYREKTLPFDILYEAALPWLNEMADRLVSYGVLDNVFLICDLDNIDTLAGMLSVKLSRPIYPINHSLTKMADYLSNCGR